MKVQCLFETAILLPTRSETTKKLFSHMYCQRAVKWEQLIVKCFCHENECSPKTKQNLSTSLTLKTKSPLDECLKVVHHPQLACDSGSSKVQELLPSRAGNEIPNRCGPGVKKKKVNTPHPSQVSTSVKTEININSRQTLVWR